MKCCDSCVAPCCDNCIYFEYNGTLYIDDHGKEYPNALYVEKGYCRKFDMCADPASGCTFFKCKRLTAEN